MTATIFASKVIANTALGIWAGYNVAVALPPSSSCHSKLHNQLARHLTAFGFKLVKQTKDVKERTVSTIELLQRSVHSLHVSSISGLALVPNFLAYLLSDRSGKHPYLIYVALGAQLVGALQFFGSREIIHQIKSVDEDASEYEHIASNASTTTSSSSTGSEVHFSLQNKYGIFSTVCAGLSAFLFVVNTVGLAGDISYA